MNLTPHIVVRDLDRAARWYGDAFGAVERSRIPLPGGKVMTIELAFGDSTVMAADEFPDAGILSPLSIGATAVVLHLQTDDVEALWERALAAGATPHRPLQDTFWGDRHGQVDDPFGHRWGMAEHVRDVPHDEVVRAAAAAFGG